MKLRDDLKDLLHIAYGAVAVVGILLATFYLLKPLLQVN